MGRKGGTRRVLVAAGVVVSFLGNLAPVAAETSRDRAQVVTAPAHTGLRAFYERQLAELGVSPRFTPFLHSDAKVKTGREVFGEAAPDLDGDSTPEVFEIDLRYSYTVNDGGQTDLPSLDETVTTRITLRNGATGRKIWAKRFDEDAWPAALRVGRKGHMGLVIIRGIWSWFGPAEDRHLVVDAREGKKGHQLWIREYRGVAAGGLITYAAEDSPFLLAGFNAVEGRAEDLLVGLETTASALLTETTAVRVVVIDGRDGSESVHPIVDVGVDWWPIPLPVGDMDGDGLDDYATTNDPGLDPGQGQELPTVGGTVYVRKGTDGSSIWTESEIEMDDFAVTDGLPDVAGNSRPEIALLTYKGNKDRVYLMDGGLGEVRWHRDKQWWIQSPGDIDGDGTPDVVLVNLRANFEKGVARFEQTALRGSGAKIWHRAQEWSFETGECPKGLCFGSYGIASDSRSDVQPDGIRDTLSFMSVNQNELFDDMTTFMFDGRTGRALFKDDAEMQSPGVAIDGHGADLMRLELKNNLLHVSARTGSSNHTLWKGVLAGPDKILPRQSYYWAEGFELPNDRCGDIVFNLIDDDETFYGVIDGATGKVLWSHWTGQRAEHPRMTHRVDHNRAC